MTRLSPTVKRRLQASLENLTAREAGRLYAIYALEADKKDIPVRDYPPVKELEAAFETRVAKSRRKPEETQVVTINNGFVYLRNILAATNEVFSHITIGVSFDNFRAMSGLLFLLHQDAMTEAIRGLKGRVIDNFPRAVEVYDYDRLLEWSKTDALRTLNDAGDQIYEAIPPEEKEEPLDPEVYERVAKQALDDAGLTAEEALQIAEATIEREKEERTGDEEFNAICDDLERRLQAGELVGGEGFYTNELDFPVLIVEGCIPAWAALRVAWRPYVRSRGLQIYDMRDWEEWSVELVDQVGANGESLSEGDLRKLAGDFYKDCRRRPWGKGLVAKPDLDDLVKLLTQSANPFLHLKPYDFGRVNWKAFSKNEVDWRGKSLESEPVATVASLNVLPDNVRRGEDFSHHDYMRSRYYPTIDSASRRAEISRNMAMFDRLETTRQPFTFDRKEDGELPLSDFMGIKFMTPFEQGVERLRRAKAATMAVDVAMKGISDRYFGGLPVALKELEEYLSMGKDYLASAEEVLSSWLEELPKWPWKIDVSGFRLDDVVANEELVETIIDQVTREARRAGRFTTESEDDLLGKE